MSTLLDYYQLSRLRFVFYLLSAADFRAPEFAIITKKDHDTLEYYSQRLELPYDVVLARKTNDNQHPCIMPIAIWNRIYRVVTARLVGHLIVILPAILITAEQLLLAVACDWQLRQHLLQ